MLKNAALMSGTKFLSELGYFTNVVLMSTYLADKTGSAATVAIFLTFRVFGNFGAGYLANVSLRLFPGVSSLVVSDLLRGLTALSFIFLAPMSNAELWIGAFLMGVGGGTFNICLRYLTPAFFPQGDLLRVNSWLVFASSAGMVAGSFAGGWLYSWLGLTSALLVNGLAYLGSAFLCARLRVISDTIPNDALKKSKTFRDQLRVIRAFARADLLFLGLLLVALLDTLGSAAHNVGLPLLAKDILPENPGRVMSGILGTWALGNVMGAFCVRRIGRGEKMKDLDYLFFCCVALMSSSFVGLFFSDSAFMITFFSFLSGCGDGGSKVAIVTRVQHAPTRVRLPAFAVLELIHSAGFGVGMMLCSAVLTILSVKHSVALFHAIPITVTLVILMFMILNLISKDNETKFAGITKFLVTPLDIVRGKVNADIHLTEEDREYARLLQFGEQAISALGSPDGPSHMEVFLSPDDEIVFLEVAARFKGLLGVESMAMNFARNPVNLSFAYESGLKMRDFEEAAVPCFDGIVPLKQGTVERLNLPDLESDFRIDWKVKEGQVVGDARTLNEFGAYFLVWNQDRGALSRDFEKLASYVPIVYRQDESRSQAERMKAAASSLVLER